MLVFSDWLVGVLGFVERVRIGPGTGPAVSAGDVAEGELPRVGGEPGEQTLVVEVLQRDRRGRPTAGGQPADELVVER